MSIYITDSVPAKELLRSIERYLTFHVAANIPCTLPTDADIETSNDVSTYCPGLRVVRVGDCFLVKMASISILSRERKIFPWRTIPSVRSKIAKHTNWTSPTRLCLRFFVDTYSRSPTLKFSAKLILFKSSLGEPACGLTISPTNKLSRKFLPTQSRLLNHVLRHEYKVTIINWDKASWYPIYWQYGAAYFAYGR